MTSAFHFTDPSEDHKGDRALLEFEMALAPPNLKSTVYFLDKFVSHTLISERFDVKSLARDEYLESRSDWATLSHSRILGDVRVLSPLDVRGRGVELSALCIWKPRFAILRWEIKDCHLAAAVRPSPPYHDWVQEHIAPIDWMCAVTHLGRKLDKLRAPRHPPKIDHSPGSNSIAEDDLAPIPAHPYQPLKCDQAIQITPPRKLIHDQSFQVGCPIMADKGIGPDLILLEVSIVPYRAVNFYHPHWPVVWIDVVDQSGVIRDTLWSMPTPPEIEVLVDQFPPETTHEVEGPPPVYGSPPGFLAAVNRAGRAFRPPPPMFPMEPRPLPPDVDPHYIPAPPGIRDV